MFRVVSVKIGLNFLGKINNKVDKDNRLIFENYISIQEGWKDILAAGSIGLASMLGPQSNIQAQPAQSEYGIDYNNMFDYISQSEGKGKAGRPGYMYKDHKGYPTIGIGHLITRDTPRIFQKLFGNIDVNKYTSGQIPLTEPMMQKLFHHDVRLKLNLARRKIPKFDTYPQNVKNAIIDALYRGDLGPKTTKHINTGRWDAAAKEYLNHDEYREELQKNQIEPGSSGIPARMERNRDQFLTLTKQGTKNAKQGTKDADEKAIIVKQGDTLSSIASQNKITLQRLLQANPQIKDPNKIQLGQQIKLP